MLLILKSEHNHYFIIETISGRLCHVKRIYFGLVSFYCITDENRDRYVYLLLRKDSRARWEDEFAQRYIVPVVQVYI